MRFGRLFIGLLSGLTFGMLFAPKKGKDLRKQIARKAEDSPAEGLRVLADALVDAGSEAYAEFLKLSESEQVQTLKTLSKEKFNEVLGKAEDHGYEVAEKVQDEVKKAARRVKSTAKGVLKKTTL